MSVPALPQEIIHQILSNLPTRYLCTLLPTSKYIYLDVTGILHSRLESDLLNKGDHKLIFEAFLPSDQRSVPYNLSTYTHTAPESDSFTSSLYSYFSLSSSEAGFWPGRLSWPTPGQAVYSFTLSPDDPWAQLALQGNLVKLSPQRPGVIKATVPCFHKQDFVRLKKIKLDQLADAAEGEMIWVNPERREVGVWTSVMDRSVLDGESTSDWARGLVLRHGVPLYVTQREGSVRYTLCFEYMAMKTGFLLSKLEEMERVDKNTMAIIWRGPNQGEL